VPRYCLESGSAHLSPTSATVRLGPGCYCEEYILANYEGGDVDEPCEAI
jgi:hypothetical protein